MLPETLSVPGSVYIRFDSVPHPIVVVGKSKRSRVLYNSHCNILFKKLCVDRNEFEKIVRKIDRGTDLMDINISRRVWMTLRVSSSRNKIIVSIVDHGVLRSSRCSPFTTLTRDFDRTTYEVSTAINKVEDDSKSVILSKVTEMSSLFSMLVEHTDILSGSYTYNRQLVPVRQFILRCTHSVTDDTHTRVDLDPNMKYMISVPIAHLRRVMEIMCGTHDDNSNRTNARLMFSAHKRGLTVVYYCESYTRCVYETDVVQRIVEDGCCGSMTIVEQRSGTTDVSKCLHRTTYTMQIPFTSTYTINQGRKHKIIVVEDDQVTQHVIVKNLTNRCGDVIDSVVCDVYENTLARLRHGQNFSVVVVDYDLGMGNGMNGYTLVRELRKNDYTGIIIGITGSESTNGFANFKANVDFLCLKNNKLLFETVESIIKS